MNEQETFDWLVERSNKLDAYDRRNRELEAEILRLRMEIAALRVAPIIERERLNEDVGDVMNLRLD